MHNEIGIAKQKKTYWKKCDRVRERERREVKEMQFLENKGVDLNGIVERHQNLVKNISLIHWRQTQITPTSNNISK